MKSEGRAGLSVWGGGQLLAFSGLDGPTDFEHGVVARTAKDGRAAVEIMLPERALLVFGEAAPVEIDVTGDTLRARTGRGESRLVFADAHHLLVEGPCRVEGPDGGPMPEALRVAQSGDRTLVGTASAFEESWLDADAGGLWEDRRAWLATAVERVVGVGADGGSVPGRRGATLRKALSVMKTQVCTPEGLLRHRWTTPDRWPHRKIWLWDSGFHAAGWRHVDPPLAREMLSAVVDTQRPDGRIPISTDPFGRETGAFTQPPVLALAVALVDEAARDDEWLASMYEPLVRYVEWDLANRDSDGAGLVEWAIEGDPGCRSGESGADNSSRFDAATQLDAPDFNALLAHELEHLAAFADR
ncbi:MAG: MGH1-like glycoside hydrolase domain-containing protein, partial [bacterium]